MDYDFLLEMEGVRRFSLPHLPFTLKLTLTFKLKITIILLHIPCAMGKFLKIAQVKPDELLFTRQTTILVAQW